MSTHNYKIIFFDWNKTLSHSRFWQQLEDSSHLGHKDGQKITEFLFVKNRPLLSQWMKGQINTQEIVREVKAGTGISSDFILEELKKSCETMDFVFNDIEETVNCLQGLGIRCVIATDNMDTFRTYTIPALRLNEIFDDFLISNELGVMKYDVDKNKKTIPFFDNYLKRNNLLYRDVVLVDDCIDDGFYAELGFNIVQVKEPADLRSFIETILR